MRRDKEDKHPEVPDTRVEWEFDRVRSALEKATAGVPPAVCKGGQHEPSR
jgi:hypothetical protein